MLAVVSAARGQAAAPAGPTTAPAAGGDVKPFKPEELEQIAAPIALYPDSLLAQVFMASTYPVELVQADRWRAANKDLKGDALGTEELSLRFSPQWAYMYKGFTRPEYRGQRLHAIGMALAMMEHSREGCHGLVSYVESNNYNSLKSCYRMGYVKAGTIVALRVGGRYLIRVGRGCAPFGLGLRAVRA